LPKLADALYDAVEIGLFAKELEIAESAREALTIVYDEEVLKALFEVAHWSD